MQIRFVKYNEENNENELISIVTDDEYNRPISEIFNLLLAIKKSQEKDFDVWVEINKTGMVDDICTDGYEIINISLILPDKYRTEGRLLPYIQVELKDKV